MSFVSTQIFGWSWESKCLNPEKNFNFICINKNTYEEPFKNSERRTLTKQRRQNVFLDAIKTSYMNYLIDSNE